MLDMSREILETIHVPLDVTRFLDFKHGREHGRIYRIAPPKYQYPGSPRLSDADTLQLVALLASPHGWYRETAHRLLYERQDRAAVPALRRLLASSETPQARLHALWSLDGLDSLSDADIMVALEDSHRGVRRHGMRLAEPRLDNSPKVLDRLLTLTDDTDPHVQLQLAFSLGFSADPRAASALATMVKKFGEDRWIRTAVLSSASRLSGQMFGELLGEQQFATTSSGRAILERLLTVVGSRGDEGEVDLALKVIAESPVTTRDYNAQIQLVVALGEAIRRTGNTLSAATTDDPGAADFLRRLFEQANRTALDEKAAFEQRPNRDTFDRLRAVPGGRVDASEADRYPAWRTCPNVGRECSFGLLRSFRK